MIETIITKITNYKETNRQLNEENTKMTLVVPMMEHLGYNPRNLDEIESEFTSDMRNNGGEKVDYSIMNNGKPFIFVEVKPLGTILEKHIGQLQRYYVSDNEVKYGILTDGQKYMFFTDDERENIMDITPFYEIDILNLTETDGEFLKLYTKENIQDEIKLETERKSFKLRTFIENHIKNPDDDFIDYISKLVGVPVTKQYVKELINSNTHIVEAHIDDTNYKETSDKPDLDWHSKVTYPLELELNKKGLRANATYIDENTVILRKDSNISKDVKLKYNNTKQLREELVTDQNTTDKGTHLVLTKDLEINHSYVLRLGASLVLGEESSGINNWKVKGTGKSLRKYFNIGRLVKEAIKPKTFTVFGETVKYTAWHQIVIHVLNKIIEKDPEAFEKIKGWKYTKTFHIISAKPEDAGESYNEMEITKGEKVCIAMGGKDNRNTVDRLLKETTLPNNTITYNY